MWIFIAVLAIVLVLLLKYLNKDYYVLSLCKRVKTTDGSDLEDKVYIVPGSTRFGNNLDILKMNAESIFRFSRINTELAKGKSYLQYFVCAPVYNITNAEDAEEVLRSQQLIRKGVIYDLLHPFLGSGLLTSTDQKWHFRRKTLTATFHFNILQTFIEVFKEESAKFVEALSDKEEQTVAVGEVIPEFTLNNICETALGVNLDNVEGSREYRDTIHDIEGIIVKRFCNPLMYNDPVFYMWGDYEEQRRKLKIAHEFSSQIIQKRREEFKQSTEEGIQQFDEFGKKKRYAMLDTLLDAESKGFINHPGICEEVNTFMFEGYDTTSTCLIFALLNLALNQEVQEKCYQEVEDLDDVANLTVFDFNKLEYLECVIKETLRLYPSVPFITRQCMSETQLNGLILPKLTQINVHIYDIMRDARHFPKPAEFEPERFMPHNNKNRHPYSFIPFSAGPRNCIGQKFAILEIKVLLVSLIKNFQLKPITQLEDIVFENGMVLRTQQEVYVKLVKRPQL